MKQRIIIFSAILIAIIGMSGVYFFSQKAIEPRAQEINSQTHTAMAHQITIKNFAFAPRTITVPAGSKVMWTNNDTVAHTATSNNGAFDTGTINPHQSKSITLQKKGTFMYHCAIHPQMMGTIIVN